MTLKINEAGSLVRSILHRIDVLKSPPVVTPFVPKAINYLEFGPATYVTGGSEVAGNGFVLNGGKNYIIYLTDYDKPTKLETEWQIHEHSETFQVLEGMIEVTMETVDHLRVRAGEHFKVPPLMPHQINVYPHTKMVMTWIRVER